MDKDLCTINITNVPVTMRKELKIAAAKTDRPYNSIIVEAIDDWLRNWRQKEEER